MKQVEVYFVSNPATALGMPYWAHWAVSINGSFHDAYRTKKEATDVKVALLEQH